MAFPKGLVMAERAGRHCSGDPNPAVSRFAARR
jgi:hypothetical protein